ncbi:epidermis-specific secreted glycoprotein EP1-like [Melia azedarach]|uniref:Epidermis-specific secreted glycoprotein EP1-like n=1 Tax=Melia azedarach TaxID=155640 RepID=A0ACC1YTT5_MELAZ|nr:epidermis-specific secreted glycoprotein EP1-like [Melia azedarach]
MSSSSALFSSFFLLSLIFSIAKAQVPPSETFRFVNEGEFGPFINEYDADYRPIGIFNAPFQVAFYNTTPNAYTLALRLGLQRNEPLYRWVWEANRGKPVRENATFSLGTDGNLVLAEADGTVVWQSNTANKGVVGFKLLPNGNMVLHDSKGKFIWQSFDFPTDTLLVGQSLRIGGVNKLVSRASVKQNVNGPYSFVLEPNRLALYYKSNNSPRPVVYFSFSDFFSGTLQNVTFNSAPETDEAFAYQLTLDSSTGSNLILARPKYNGTISFLRLAIDGNLRIFTYYDKVDSQPTENTFTLFDRDSIWETECQLPERCGKLGVCDDNQCVACPTEKGLLGWSKDCGAKKVDFCRTNDFHYFKVEGVDHYISKFNNGTGPIKIEDCRNRCSSDCRCVGYFYHKETSKCWIAFDLHTLTKVANATHVGFIKVLNK